MPYSRTDALVSTEWLANNMNAPDIKIVDATFLLGKDMSVAIEAFKACHIPEARFFDINEIADTTNGLPHMLPSPEKFASRVRDLGLGDGNRIIVYDQNGGTQAAARVWWMFRVFGHKDVAVLNGGLPKWVAEDRPTADLPPYPHRRHFTTRVNTFLVRDFNQITTNLQAKKEQVLDARSPERFAGSAPEPREGLKSGHIPGSINLPFSTLVDGENHNVMRTGEELEQAFADAGVDMDKPIVASCGSGVTACVIALAGYLIGKEDIAVYDGSWTEWGAADGAPVEAG